MTQHDLSANETKVSFALLCKTAQIAVGLSKTACERALGAAQTASMKSDLRGLKYAAADLSQAAEAFRVSSDTLFVLQESTDRDVFTVLR